MNIVSPNSASHPPSRQASTVGTVAGQTNPWPLRGFYLFLVSLVLFVSYFAIFRPITVLPRITLAPGFIFTNTAGESVTSEDFRGGLTLYSFSYTGCEAHDCPQSLADIEQAYEQLNQLAPSDIPVSLVTISLDPERDNTAVLSATEQALNLSPDASVAWHLLSGDALRTKSVVGGGLGMFYDQRPLAIDSDDSNDYFIRFEPKYVLVDGLGVIRAYYDEAIPDPAILERDLNLVLTEARNSEGLGRLGYEAAHLFVCYP